MTAKASEEPTGAGKSSFDLIDTDLFLKKLDLQPGEIFLDLAWGRGVYTLAIAEHFPRTGLVIGVDLWAQGIERLNAEAASRGFASVKGLVGDAGDRIPLGDHSVDVVLVATALHDFVNDGIAENALREIGRTLRPGGRIVIVEFKKIDGPPGPPITSRLAPEQVVELLEPHHFCGTPATALGPSTYLMTFRSG